MQNYTYVVDLRIHHPSIDPADITRTLGLAPSRSWCAGKPRATPKGTLLQGINSETYWSGDINGNLWTESSDEAVEDALMRMIGFLEPHAAFVQSLSVEGRVHVMISSQCRHMYGLELPPQILGRLAALGLSLAHEIYAGF